MKLRTRFAAATLSLFASASAALAAVPVVNTFSVAATAVSPVPITAFTASDSDGNLAAYLCTDSNTRPAAGDARWSATAPSTCATTRIGSVTLYAWAKDSAGGVSNSRSASTSVVGTHAHTIAQVTGLQAALDGKAAATHGHDAMYQQKYANVIVVAKSGGDFADPLSAVESISGAAPDNVVLVKIMPGVYEIPGRIYLKNYVTLEGSGVRETVIRAAGTVLELDGFVQTPTWANVRNLTLDAYGEAGSTVAAVVVQAGMWGASLGMKNVDVLAEGGSTNIGIHLPGYVSYLNLQDCTVTASSSGGAGSHGIFASATNPWAGNSVSLTRCTVDGGYGIGIESAILTSLFSVSATDSTVMGASGAIVMGGPVDGIPRGASVSVTGGTLYKPADAGTVVRLGAGNSLTAFRTIVSNGTVVADEGAAARLVDCRNENLDPIP